MFRIVVNTLFIFMVLVSTGSAVHYYHFEDEVPLYIDSSKLVIRFANVSSPRDLNAAVSQIERLDAVLEDNQVFDDYVAVSLTSSAGYVQLVDSLRGLAGIEMVEPYYLNWMDSAMVVGSTILAQFQAWVSNEQADSIIALYGGEAFYPYGPSETVYAIRNLPATGISTLDLANIYNNLPESRYAHPEFGVRMVPFSYNLYDYYSINQDNIKKVIGQFNQASVWDFHGVTETIRVGLIDDGVAAHEDLPASRLLTSIDADYFDNDGDASPGPYKGHGMACVGILAASHTTDPLEGQSTTSGIISMAPNVEILPIKIASSSTGEWGQGGVATYAIRWAIKQGCNVISCSWGWPRKPDLDDDQGVASLYLILDSAYSEGIPIFFPSGNFTYNYVGYPGNHPKTFAVGASDLDDYRWSYSQYGLGLDVVAPSGNHFVGEGIWTLDQMGAIGRNPNVSEFGLWNYGTPNDINYNCLFDGTSAAVPIVSGTAALILSFDSTLGVNECTTFYGTPQ